MTTLTRRGLLATGPVGVLGALAACSSPLAKSAGEIDGEVRASREQLYASVPGAARLGAQAAGLLIIPEIIKGGLFVSGAYGEGALMIGDAVTDYISMSSAGFGLQIGAQRYSQALFFMTPEVLRDFRVTDGWELGVNAEFATPDEGSALGTSTTTINEPVYAVIYGQRGLIVGASLAGSKYSRLIRG